MNITAQQIYEDNFNNKINHFKEHPKYSWLRQYADEALTFHTCFGYYAIKAIDFMDRIIAFPVDYIQDWLDGKNKLEWGNKE